MTLELTVCSRRRFRRTRRWTFNATGGLIVLLVLAFVLPPAFGLSRYTVTDDAMSGTVERGSAVFARSLPVADLRVGDVITYPHPSTSGELITRRIADIEGGVIWTRSDSSAIDPRPLTPDQSTRARAVFDVPLAGYAYDALSGGARLVWATVSEIP